MPKINRGGKRTQSQSTPNINTSFGGGTSGVLGQGVQPTPVTPIQNATQNATAQPAQSLNQNTQANSNYTPTFTDNYETLDDNYNDWLYQQHTREMRSGLADAMKQYISSADAGGGYSMAQWLNYKINNNQPLNGNEKEMLKQITNKSYAIQQKAVLFRADHDDVLRDLGIADYEKYTEKQLNNMLVGASWTNKAMVSTSYDKNKNPFYHLANNSNSSNSGGREVYYNYYVSSNVKIAHGDRTQAEFVLAPNQNFKITGVRYDKSTATPRGKGLRKRIVVDVEVS